MHRPLQRSRRAAFAVVAGLALSAAASPAQAAQPTHVPPNKATWGETQLKATWGGTQLKATWGGTQLKATWGGTQLKASRSHAHRRPLKATWG